ncbi:ABC transporter substrate-binding protein [Streptomyces sp. NPDC046925]|uniref:caspase, EACC1-associated type n=1 Tax=Streptomyces sp. NPDC046925 TaxID=3155375 RepID=UPI0033FF2AE7
MAELADPSRSVAVLVGVHAYTTLPPLPAVKQNLKGLARALKDPGIWGLPGDRCTVLDQPDSAQTVLDTVQRAARRAEDTLVVYFAGHGLTDPHTDELYLALPDSDVEREYTSLRYEYLRRAVLAPQSRARRTVVILDCCYSGRALIGRMSASGHLADQALVEGSCLLTASAETSVALSPPGEKYTAFTGELITALTEGVPGAPDPLDMESLYRHLRRELAQKSRPLPQQRNRNTGGLIALARNVAPAPPEEPSPEAPAAPTAPEATRGSPPAPMRRRISRKRTAVSLAVLGAVVATTSVAAALSLRDKDANGSNDSSSGGAGAKTVVTIGVDVPITGKFAPYASGIKNSADLAVRQANKDEAVDGVTFKIKVYDSKSQSSEGRRNAADLVKDKDIIGVVGPMGDKTAAAMQKPLDAAHLALVSPGATAESLTRGVKWQSAEPDRPAGSFFRTVPTNAVQGYVGARFLHREAKKSKAYVIHDTGNYGASLAAGFETEFRKLGGKVVGADHVHAQDEDFSAVVARVKNSGADVVYYGGEAPAAGRLGAQLEKEGADVVLAGGDLLFGDEFRTTARKGAEGAYITVRPSPDGLVHGKKFVKDYKKADYKESYGLLGGYSYDATRAIIHAVGKVAERGGKLPENPRAKVVEALQGVSLTGAMGRISFDPYGDVNDQSFAVYTIRAGQWDVAKRSLEQYSRSNF